MLTPSIHCSPYVGGLNPGVELSTRRPTINDVAKRAGVSKATVSRVLNGTSRVVPETAQAVRTAIDEVGYVMSWSARALAKGKAETIGIIVTEPFEIFGQDPTFHVLLEGIFEGLASTELTPLVVHASSSPDQRKVLSLIESRLFDAVIHMTPYEDDLLLDSLNEADMPTVLCSRLQGDPWQGIFSTVYADDVAGAAMGAAHMRERGVANPVVIMGPENNPAAVERVEGILTVFPSLDPNRIIHAGWDESTGQLGVLRFLADSIAFDGIICGSDRIAAGAMKALHHHHLEVPDEVKVIGFDDHPLAQAHEPPLSTVAQPMQDEGRQAAALALDLIEGGKPTTVELPMSLKQRKTT